MNFSEIEDRLAAIEPRPGVEYLEDLLLAYGLPKASVARLMTGAYDKADSPDERLWKSRVYFRYADEANDVLYALIDSAKDHEAILKQNPRFLVVKNDEKLLAVDRITGASLDIEVTALSSHASFFGPWAGYEKTQLENVNYADVKAAEKMAKLYDEIVKRGDFETAEQRHDLNVFFSRLLFCFFAEDTGVFEAGSFTNAIASHTRESGEDTHELLDRLFTVLDLEMDDRDGVPEHFRSFGYVNGNLFATQRPAPRFSARARSLVLECSTLDWSEINPDIFGSMIQAVVQPGERQGLGMHYTSVENIMKVIRPLFLDELEAAFESSDTLPKLERLLQRIASIRIFDPACGSGNFLVIAYKELRRLEHRILQRQIELDPGRGQGLFKSSSLKLENFYGIEIEDFPHEIAILSLWLAKHQMNVEFEELFGAEIPLIPLRDSGSVARENAARIDWGQICDPASTSETYLIGNPPYAGSSMQGPEQKDDFVSYFGTRSYPKNLDYISLWFLRGADFLSRSSSASLAFVSTNSISQGDHAGLLWPRMFEKSVQLSFAHQSFLWTNLARGRAGVTCVIVGLVRSDARPANELYTGGVRRKVVGISPYLLEGNPRLIVHSTRTRNESLPALVWGSKPTDGGHLIMTSTEREELLRESPEAGRFVRRYVGTDELLNGRERYCLWISDEEAARASSIPSIAPRLDGVRRARLAGSTTAQAMADRPYRFLQRAHRDTTALAVPALSSERRAYIPMDFVGPDTVISNSANAVYDAEPWLFGLIQSRIHMAWTRAVAGRMKSDIRYSAVLVYNTFPFPDLSGEDKEAIGEKALKVLATREVFADQTLAELYDPDKTPKALRQAHAELDETVDRLYRSKPFNSDEERLDLLFSMYEESLDEHEEVSDVA